MIYAKQSFDPTAFLTATGSGRRIVRLEPRHSFFLQGDSADWLYFLRSGRARITVVSSAGKEATITIVPEGDFLGEEALAGGGGMRLTTATAITTCLALKIGREEMLSAMRRQHDFNELFLKFLLERNLRIQADLIDQLFNFSEKRLARALLLMAESGKLDNSDSVIPKISHETLAEMVGTTRSRVCFFMNRFRKQGFIVCNGQIEVRDSLRSILRED